MGLKERAFGPLPSLTLEELVPPEHFYRHLERTLDLGFMRDLVRDAYAGSGNSCHTSRFSTGVRVRVRNESS